MENLNQHIALLFIPLILSNILHMVFVKKNVFHSLKIPISTVLFGKNKTTRGFFLLPILSGLIAAICSYIMGPFFGNILSDSLFSASLGIAYLLAELPNSFVKRRLGIENGGYSKNFKYLQLVIDRVDSLIGIFTVYFFMTNISIKDSFMLFIVALVISFATSFFLYALKIKKSV